MHQTPSEWVRPSHDTTIDPLLAWLTDHFHDLADEGQDIVNRYWQGLRVLEDNHPYQWRATLGLRMRLRENLALSLEWYLMGTMGRSKKPIARVHIAKGRNQDTYSLKVLMRRQPVWLTEFVEEIEKELTQIRMRQSRLIRIRDALGEFMKIESGRSATGSQLMTRYLARDTHDVGSRLRIG
jgi:hypothetical protein